MKKLIIVTAAFVVLIGLGYLIYSIVIIPGSPCADLFDQITASSGEKIKAMREKGEAILRQDQIQNLSEQSDQITADLKTCCILFHDDKVPFDEFLK